MTFNELYYANKSCLYIGKIFISYLGPFTTQYLMMSWHLRRFWLYYFYLLHAMYWNELDRMYQSQTSNGSLHKFSIQLVYDSEFRTIWDFPIFDSNQLMLSLIKKNSEFQDSSTESWCLNLTILFEKSWPLGRI